MSKDTFEQIVSAANQEELKRLRQERDELYELLVADGKISAIAIYTDDRTPEGEWENTGALFYGKPILRQPPARRQELLADKDFMQRLNRFRRLTPEQMAKEPIKPWPQSRRTSGREG